MPPKKTTSKEKYTEAIGRRKTATARVRLTPKKSAKEIEVIVNGKEITKYFPVKKNQDTVHAPFKALALTEYVGHVIVSGGGMNAQAEAIRLGFARALVAIDPSWRSALKTLGFLKRDPRMVERKKFGSRKARRPQQWRKR